MAGPEYLRRGRVYPRSRTRATWKPQIPRRRRAELGWPPSADSLSVPETGTGSDAVAALTMSGSVADVGLGLEAIDVVKEPSFHLGLWTECRRQRRTKYLKQLA